MAKKGEKKENKFSASNILATVLLIIIAGILIMTLFEHTIFESMVEIIENFIKDIVQTIGHYGLINSIKMVFKMPVDPIPNMEVYRIGDDQIEMLKNSLLDYAVNPDHAGLTEILLRKILIANCVSTSLDNTLCIAPVTEKEIVDDINKRFDKNYEDDEAKDALKNECKKEKNSKDVWPAEHADNPNYDLYYVSKVFFYFKDKDKKFDSSYDGWYLGAMGATSIEAEDEDTDFVPVSEADFKGLYITQFNNALGSGKKLEEAKTILTSIYYKIDSNTIGVYNLKSTEREYEFKLENDDNNIEYEVEGEDEAPTYNPEIVQVRIDENIDTSSYALPIELLVDMLNVSQSGEFLENFIDYALEKIKVKVRAYPVEETTITYELTTYDIDNDFVVEVYDIIGADDSKNDNFKAYRPIIFGRKDTDGNSFSGSVVELDNFDDIDLDGEEYGPTKADGSRDKYDVPDLKSRLKVAFDPGSKFDDSSENECYEKITTYQTETNWQLAPSKVYTWYGDFKYSKPSTKTETTNSLAMPEEEYDKLIGIMPGTTYSNEFKYMEAEGTFEDKGTESIIRAYIIDTLNNQSPIDGTAGVDVHVVNGLTANNLTKNSLKTEPGVENKSHFWNHVVKGLIEVAENDDGKYDSDNAGSDYIYADFDKEHKRVYEAITKTKREFLDTANVTETVQNPDDTFKAFLSMLKNENGVIPNEPGVDQQFVKDGKVVMYDGVNDLKVPAGDLLLDNGALELFEYLEMGDNTQKLADIFRYLAYLYTGKDYGVTEANINDILSAVKPSAMSSVSTYSGGGTDQLKRYIRSWENVNPPIVKNLKGEDCYKIEPDGGGGYAVGYGVDIATFGAKLRAMGYSTNPGDLIPVALADQMSDEEIMGHYDYVSNKLSDLKLTEYQKYALTSRCYGYGDEGGIGRATWYFIYPSSHDFRSAYNAYYASVDNDKYFKDYTKTDFSNGLWSNYMIWLNYAKGKRAGTHPPGWEPRKKSEWSLFQTGYFGYGLKIGSYGGMDEYYEEGGTVGASSMTNNINLYNADGTVNQASIQALNNWLTQDMLHTTIHNNGENQSGPFATWWDSKHNIFSPFQCTWYAYGRANQFLEQNGTKYKKWPGSSGNAKTWYRATDGGGEKYFQVGQVPRQNSIVVLDGGTWGHVMYVEAVDNVNKRVYFSHAGYGTKWKGIESKTFDEMKTLYGYTLLGYVYLDSPK